MKSDLAVDAISNSLSEKTIDVVVTGSIAAVEAVRFVRALRRLGAKVRVILSEGGAKFITPMALEWASNHDVQCDFSGKISHLADNDALVVAPASANFLTSVARGDSNTAERALFQSYLGLKKPVLVLPCMHSSLSDSPLYKEAIGKMETHVRWLNSRDEEGKNKFPDPALLADQVSHLLNFKDKHILLTMGGTRASIDDVRYIGNLSTGSLGTKIHDELYRAGYQTHVVCGAAEFRPVQCTQRLDVSSVHEMQNAVVQVSRSVALAAGIFSAAVSDYEPIAKQSGKLRSGSTNLTIELRPTPKILESVKDWPIKKIGFKLEPELNDRTVRDLYTEYKRKYHLDAMILNAIKDVGFHKHLASFVTDGHEESPVRLETKQDIACAIVEWLQKGEKQ